MANLREIFQRFTPKNAPLAAGIYTTPLGPHEGGRLHLRIESDGSGVLVVNAATILHLNQTAAEYAYHLVQGSPVGEVGSQVSRRYNISASQARADFEDFAAQINTLRTTTDLDPEMYLNMSRVSPRSQLLSAPLRMDCALTYRLPAGTAPSAAPAARAARELDTADWQKILDASWQSGIPQVIFTGGEPTLRDDLVALVTHAESLGMVSGLLTDGLRFNQPGYLDSLLNSGLDHCVFLLDLDNDDSWKALRRALEADLFVGVHVTVQTDSGHYNSLVEKLAGLGVRAVSLTAASPALNTALSETAQAVAELGMELIWDIPVPYSAANPVNLEVEALPAETPVRHAGVYVEPDGDVLAAQGQPKVLGSLTRDSWQEIWPRITALAEK